MMKNTVNRRLREQKILEPELTVRIEILDCLIRFAKSVGRYREYEIRSR